ncbi:zinc-binding dehydrogenase [Streptomyces sp. H39-S7]|nr:zinc-binding dehydrogenase [Streptomyces sp. H39-S7]MCZ4123401.1 zinc-binding dehydrogenase [Streptomyces sp. H39-S7]
MWWKAPASEQRSSHPATRSSRTRLASIAETGIPGSTDVFARLDRADLAAVAAMAAAGDLSVRIGAVFPLERAAEAQRALAAGRVSGKVVVEVG